MNWINIKTEQMPLETHIIISHQYGVDAICFTNGKWRYWYSFTPVDIETLKIITHWCYPEKAS